MSEDTLTTSPLPGVASEGSHQPTETTDESPQRESTPAKKAAKGRPRALLRLRRDAPWWLYVGVVVMMAGFGLIAYAWVRVAALANVALQVPYLISSAVTGVGLVFVGLGIVDVTTRRRDARDRSRQLGQLRDLLRGIADSMEPQTTREPAKDGHEVAP